LGLVLPPNLAPIQVVIIPIYKTDEQLETISIKINEIVKDLRKKGISVKFDNRTTYKPGWKFAEYELKGVPLRIAMGPKDLENGTLEIARRDTLEKQYIPQNTVVEHVEKTLKEIQENLYNKALQYRETHITEVNSFEEFKEVLNTKGGFISAHWDGTSETEEKIKDLTKATIRCIPLDNKIEDGKCVFTGEKSTQRVLFAKAY
ncbi:MAG: His/Gly/Thr/Pro-type tRNA ligase C-terminal domain-containing protein, partial [Lutibacter sp.]